MQVRIAELNIEIRHAYPYVERLCHAYRTAFDKADLTVCASAEEVKAELKSAPTGYGITPGVAEATCIYRQIALQLPRFDAFVFHASVLSCDGVGYAFAAASGVGKSTHTALWQQVFGERVAVINGDAASIVVKSDGLIASQISQINEIVYEQAGISPVKITIIQK